MEKKTDAQVAGQNQVCCYGNTDSHHGSWLPFSCKTLFPGSLFILIFLIEIINKLTKQFTTITKLNNQEDQGVIVLCSSN